MSAPDEAGDSETTNTRTRWRFNGSAASMLLTTTMCGCIVAYVVRGGPVPVWATATFGLLCLTAAAWTFGADALKAARNAGGQN